MMGSSSMRLRGWFVLVTLAATGASAPVRAREPTGDRWPVIEARLVRSPQIMALAGGERVRVLRIVPTEADKIEAPAAGAPRIAEAILVTYESNRGLRARVDLATGDVVLAKALRGRPTSSAAEREEAREIIMRDRASGALLQQGHRLQGGFVVDPPQAGQKGRFLEFHVADPEGRVILRELIVDLATRTIAASRGTANRPAAR